MQAPLFDLDETILDRSGSLRDFVQWQASEQLGLVAGDVARFTADETYTDLNKLVGYVKR